MGLSSSRQGSSSISQSTIRPFSGRSGHREGSGRHRFCGETGGVPGLGRGVRLGEEHTAFTVVGTYPPTGGTLLFKGEDISRRAVDTASALEEGHPDRFSGPGIVAQPAAEHRGYSGDAAQGPSMVPKGQSEDKRITELLNMVELPGHIGTSIPRRLEAASARWWPLPGTGHWSVLHRPGRAYLGVGRFRSGQDHQHAPSLAERVRI